MIFWVESLVWSFQITVSCRASIIFHPQLLALHDSWGVLKTPCWLMKLYGLTPSDTFINPAVGSCNFRWFYYRIQAKSPCSPSFSPFHVVLVFLELPTLAIHHATQMGNDHHWRWESILANTRKTKLGGRRPESDFQLFSRYLTVCHAQMLHVWNI